MKNRRSLTPSVGIPAHEGGGVHHMRRGGPRREVSERARLRHLGNDAVWEGWALNVSRGGVRCILEEKVELGEEYEVTLGLEGDAPLTRRGRVVWLQEEKDGVVVGIEFLNLSGTHKSVPPAAPEPDGAVDGDGKTEDR